MKKTSKWILVLLCVSLFSMLTLFFAHAVNEQVPADDPVVSGNPEDAQENDVESEDEAAIPINPSEGTLPDQLASEPETRRFGTPLFESDDGGHVPNTTGSPWGGLLFMAAAIALGLGLAIARNKK